MINFIDMQFFIELSFLYTESCLLRQKSSYTKSSNKTHTRYRECNKRFQK